MAYFGWILGGLGSISIAFGVAILGVLLFQLLRQLRAPQPKNKGFAAEASIPDVTKLIEAIVKLPLWLLAILAGDLQIWLGNALQAGKWPF